MTSINNFISNKYSRNHNLKKISYKVILNKIKKEKKAEDQFETLIYLPDNKNRKKEGGLRCKGYFRDKTKTKPLITIITVVFNSGKKLEDTILSIINQPYKNLEYIIIDGGSKDDTLKIIQKYENSIDYWISEKDNGIYDAMNKACKLSFGDGLVFLNAGDKFIGKVFNGKLKFPFLLPCRVKSIKNKTFNRKISDMKLGMPTSHQAMVFSNKKILYQLKYKICADYDYFIRHGVFSNLDKKCSGYVLYDNDGFSQNNKLKRDYETIKILFINYGLIKPLKFILHQLAKLIKK